MVIHTVEAARRSRLAARVTMAVDHDRLAEVAECYGVDFERTDPGAASGTDRIAEVASRRPETEIFVNVQGDEPEIAGEAIDQVIELLTRDSEAVVATLATPISNRGDLEDPACVKLVCSHDGRAMYFSRSVIPHPREWEPRLFESSAYLQHLGIYAYRREFLLKLSELKPSPLEQIEKLEQLRFLQAGLKIAVGLVPSAARGIDTRAEYDAFLERRRGLRA